MGMSSAERQKRFRQSRRGAVAKQLEQQRQRERVAAAKRDGCVDCGLLEGNLHFHHVDPSTKEFNVAHMNGRSDAAFFAEVAKCVVLCKPCHEKRHREMDAA